MVYASFLQTSKRLPSAAKRSFSLGERLHCFANMVRGDAEDLEELFLFPRMRHARDREMAELPGRRSRLRQRGQNRFADAALRPVVLDHDQLAAARVDVLGERLAVDRLHAVKV